MSKYLAGRFTRSLMTAALVLGLGLAVAACNTVEGIGQDLSNSARAVKEAL